MESILERNQITATPGADGVAQQGTATAFHTPLDARLGDEPVTVIAFGDIPGHSPAYLCVNEQGVSGWVSMAKVRLTDRTVRPASLTNYPNTSQR